MGRVQPGHVALSATLGALVALSVVDLGLTLSLLRYGAEEANPLMRWFLAFDPRAFVVAKLSLTALGVGLLWALRDQRSTAPLATLGLAVYAGVMVAHWLTLEALRPR